MKPVIRYIVIFASAIAVVVLVRQFAVGSYRIAGSAAGKTLRAGDCVLVDKLHKIPSRNRLLLYKSPLQRDAAAPPLFVGRSIGAAGDTIKISADGLRINGRLLPVQLIKPMFRINKEIKDSLLNTMTSLNIPLRDLREDSVSLILRMSVSEKDLLNSHLSQVVRIEPVDENRYANPVTVLIPSKGKTIVLDPVSLVVYREAIMHETNGAAEIRDGKMFLNGREILSFAFNNDYFWALSDNETEGVDSRHLGLIPNDCVIGVIRFCWYSSDSSRRFKKVK